MIRHLWLLVGFTILFSGCTDEKETERLTLLTQSLRQENSSLKASLKQAAEGRNRLQSLASKLSGVKARIVTNYGNIELGFFPQKAPIHCFNFIARAESGFYDSTQFHRVMPGFMIQGGDPNSKDKDPENDGSGGPVVNIPHEFNDTRHMRGILSMARTSDKSVGAGTQFFVMHASKPHLDGEYTAFGQVTGGMDVVDRIANARTYENPKNPSMRTHPVKPVVIKTIEVYR